MTKLFRSLALALAALVLFDAHAQKISADPTASTLAGSEYLAGVQSGANVKVLPSQIQTLTLTAPTTTGKLTTAASTTGGAGFRLPHGAAPTSPVNGDVWTTSAGGLYAYINGSTVGPFSAGGSGTVTSVGMTVPSFLSVSGSPVTTSGTLAVTLSGTALPVVNGGTGTTTPALVAGTNVTITGTWPNQTINSTASGAGLTNFTESSNSSSPNATVPAVRLIATNAATNVDIVIAPKGTGSILAQIPDSSSTGGNKRGANAVDWQTSRGSASQVAGGANSVVAGGDSNSTTSSSYGVVGGGQTNVSSNFYTTVAGGHSNTASGNGSTVDGGRSNTASGSAAVVVGGDTTTASGDYSLASGEGNTADGRNSSAIGSGSTTRGVRGFNAIASKKFGTVGDAQGGRIILGATSTSATPIAVTSDNSGTAGAANQIAIASGARLAFDMVCVASAPTGTDGARWAVKGLIKNNSGTVSLVGTPSGQTTADFADSGASTWAITVAADNTNKSLTVNFAGAAATTIRVVCSVSTEEVV